MFGIEKDKDIVFLDIEADHKNNKLIQFGAIKYSNGKYWQVDWYSNPECKISSHVLDIIGRNKLNIINAADNNKTVLAKIYKFIENAYFVSFGDFDYNFLNKLFMEHFKITPKILGFIDLQKEWKDMFGMISSFSLKDLGNFFDINFKEEALHDAFADAELMFKIYNKWQHSSQETIVAKMFNYRSKKDFIIKPTEKINLDFDNKEEDVKRHTGNYVMFDIVSKKIFNKDSKHTERVFLSIRTISIENNEINENWAEDLSGKYAVDKELYEHFLVYVLGKFLVSIEGKTILLYEDQIKDYKFISKLCQKYLNRRPLNSCIIINGVDKLIDFENENYKAINLLNKDLIAKWKIISSLKKNIKDYED